MREPRDHSAFTAGTVNHNGPRGRGGAKVAMTAQGPLDPELLGVAVVAGLPGLARGQVGIEWI